MKNFMNFILESNSSEVEKFISSYVNEKINLRLINSVNQKLFKQKNKGSFRKNIFFKVNFYFN